MSNFWSCISMKKPEDVLYSTKNGMNYKYVDIKATPK